MCHFSQICCLAVNIFVLKRPRHTKRLRLFGCSVCVNVGIGHEVVIVKIKGLGQGLAHNLENKI